MARRSWRFTPCEKASHRFDDPAPLVSPADAIWTSRDGCRWASPDYERFRPLFAAAIDRRFHTIEHLDALVLTSRAQVWFGRDAAIVTELRTYPTGLRAIHGLVAAGDLQEIVGELIPRVEEWARDHAQCGVAMIESRVGWQKVLQPHGYAPFQTTLCKEL